MVQSGTALIRDLYPNYPAFAPDWAVLAVQALARQ